MINHEFDIIRVLIASQDDEMIKKLILCLTENAYETVTVNNKTDARKNLLSFQPHILLVDRQIPTMNSLDLCREFHNACNIPILMLSNDDNIVDKVLSLEIGCDDFMTKEFDYSPIDKILENHEKTAVIAILQDIQEIYHYLPKEIFPYLAKKLGTGEARIYSVATFYENFSLEPKGKYVIKCCDGTACHVRKSIPILEYLRGELGLSEKKTTTDDLMFTVETVSCLGACGLAPVLTVNDVVHPEMNPDKAAALLKELREKEAE